MIFAKIQFTRRMYVALALIISLFAVIFLLYEDGILTRQNPKDTKRIKDMSVIVLALETYGKEHHGVFPESLDILVAEKYLPSVLTDPVTEKPYQYVFDSENNYSVCTYLADLSHKCLFTNAKKIGY